REAAARKRGDEHRGCLIVRERVSAMLSLVGRLQKIRRERLVEGQAHGRLASSPGSHEEVDLKLPTDNRRRAQDRVCARGKPANPLLDECRDAGWNAELGNGTPLPTLARVP